MVVLLLQQWIIWRFLRLQIMMVIGGDDINEKEDQVEKDACAAFNMNGLLRLFVCIKHL